MQTRRLVDGTNVRLTQGTGSAKFLAEIDLVYDAIKSVQMLRQAAQKSATQEEAPVKSAEQSEDILELKPAEGEQPTADSVPIVQEADPAAVPEVPADVGQQPVVTNDQTPVALYAQMQSILETLKKVDPQSPLADMLSTIIGYQRLPFRELLKKYGPKGPLARIQEILDTDVIQA